MLPYPYQYFQTSMPLRESWMTVTPPPSSKRVVFPSTLAPPPRPNSPLPPPPPTRSLLQPSPHITNSGQAKTSISTTPLRGGPSTRKAGPPPPGFSSASVPFLIPGLSMDIKYLIVQPEAIQIITSLLQRRGRGALQYHLPTAFPASTTLFLQLLRLQLSLSPTSSTSTAKSLTLEERGSGVLPRAAAHRVASTLVSIHTLFVLRTGSEELWGEMDYLEELVVELVKELEAVGTTKGGEGVELRFLDEVNNIELGVDDARQQQQGHLRPHPQTLLPNPWSTSSASPSSSQTPPLTPSSSLSSFGDDTPSPGFLPSTPTSLLSPTPLLGASPSQSQSSEAANTTSFRTITTQIILHLVQHLREVLHHQLERQPGSSTSILPTRILISTSYLLYLLAPSPPISHQHETPSAHYHLSSTLTFIAALWTVASQRGGEARAFGATGCAKASEESLRRMEYVLRLRDTALRVRESLGSWEVVGGGGRGKVVGGERFASGREKRREVGEVQVVGEGLGLRGM